MSDLTQIQRDIEWYREGERDSDFVRHLADELLVRIADLDAMLRIAAQDAWDNVHFIDRPCDEMPPTYPDFFTDDLAARIK